ncbi:hypothetical protein AI3045V2_1050 [Enterobacter cloacae]|nr:hypothetical protein AI2704V1_3287 [Enterobacter cloacae]CAE6337035.1 hypothetical protein AI2710V1_3399 [Enterobacter cloacae]CAF3156985.1 hypothetical protein AI2992V5_3202 [Enterobacter cloacae]CAF9522018.1 hypothetical protein AI3045V2_1050 [Enterobacter cloacae]CAG0280564.1 hypothetical protein AI3050V1_3333 [Enterobacter cloacae]
MFLRCRQFLPLKLRNNHLKGLQNNLPQLHLAAKIKNKEFDDEFQ